MCWGIVVKEKPTVGSQFFGAFLSDSIAKASKDANVHFFIHNFFCCPGSQKITLNINFPLLQSTRTLLLRRGDSDFHSDECCLVFGSYNKHHLSSPVTMLLRNPLSLSVKSMRSPEMLIRVFLCSGVHIRGTKCWQTWHKFSTS